MAIYAAPGATVEASAVGFATGLEGTIGARLVDVPTDTTVIARWTSGIAEFPSGSGVYATTFTAPTSAGTYQIVWDDGSSTYAAEDLVVGYTAAAAGAPSGIDLCTVAQVKRDPTLAAVGTTQDDLIQETVTQASRDFLAECGREIVLLRGTNPHAREIEVGGYYRDREIPVGDLASTPTAVSILAEDGSTAATLTVSTDVEVLPRTRESWEPITALRLRYSAGAIAASYRLSVTGTWGWPSVPEDVQLAVRDTVVFRLRQHRAVTQLSPDQFEEPEGPQRAFPLSAWQVIRRYRAIPVGVA